MKFSSLIFLAIFLMMTTSIYSQTTPPIEAGIPIELAQWRANNYSDVRYKLDLTIEKMSPTLKGTIEVSLQNKADQIILDWRKISGKENLSTISNISVNGKTVKFEEINEHLVFKDGVKRGKNIIKLNFTSPILTSGSAITRYIDKEDGSEYIYSLFVPSDASTAFPVFDQPDLKARFQLNLIIPNFWNVVSNTDGKFLTIHPTEKNLPLFESIMQQKSLVQYEETQPISTYVFSFAVGEFSVFSESNYSKELTKFRNSRILIKTRSARSVDPKASSSILQVYEENEGVKIYVRKSQAEKFKPHAQEVFRLNREVVKYLEEYFDYKFPFPKYDLVLIPEFPFGGMEHAGATFLRESSVIFPSEPTKIDYYARANVIFHEAAHQWFGDTVTMKWFDDLWLKEGFANFMAAKAMEKIMPEMNAWKIFYERTKQSAYATDSTKGTVPIYQDIPNLNSAKSAYGNIVYSKAPAFLRQAEFYLGEKEFQTAVRSFLKKYEYSNATWEDLVSEFENAAGESLRKDFDKVKDQSITRWAKVWVEQRGLAIFRISKEKDTSFFISQSSPLGDYGSSHLKFQLLLRFSDMKEELNNVWMFQEANSVLPYMYIGRKIDFVFPNYQDYGYGIFLLDEKSRNYILANVQTEKDDFLRSMMYGSLWDSVREAELNPKDYVELVIKNVADEKDEMIVLSLLNRAGTALNYYLESEPSTIVDGLTQSVRSDNLNPLATANGSDKSKMSAAFEEILINKMQSAETLGQRITFYRTFLNATNSEKARNTLKQILDSKFQIPDFKLKTKDKFDIVTKLFILGDKDADKLLAELVKTETSDEAKRYAYAAQAGIPTTENKAKYWNDFVNNKELSESWIESAFGVWNNSRHSNLTLPYLEKALAELPNLKRNRKIFFVNGWLSSFIGGQKSDEALQIVNKFLANNPQLDKDLRLKILENVDVIERAVKIRQTFNK